ncbi:MAG: MerR family transcriptional regulator [Inquilinaceae bacterium]
MEHGETLSIGELARATGVKVVTVRYYEKIGLLPVPPRTDGNYRIYGVDHETRLRFIRRCRELGFTLGQVRALLSLSTLKDADCAAVDRVATDHLAAVERKIADLERMAGELRRISHCCRGGRIADCQIIEALSPDSEVTAAE